MSYIFIGIDNGLTGGLVALGENPGEILFKSVMPTRGKSKGNEVDGAAIVKWLQHNFNTREVTAVLETPGKHSPGVQALCSMWDSYGVIRGILESLEIRHHRITPQAWQKKMLVGCKKGDTKPAALARVRQLWPHENFLATARSTKPHEGLIDAALISEYARISNL